MECCIRNKPEHNSVNRAIQIIENLANFPYLCYDTKQNIQINASAHLILNELLNKTM